MNFGLYNCQEIFGKYEEIFQLDFDFDDIKDRMQEFLTPDEFQTLRNTKLSKEKIERLIFILSYHHKNINEFLNILKIPYDWLEDSLRNALTNVDRADLEIDQYRRILKDIPQNGAPSVYRCEFLWQIIKELKHLRRGEYLVVHGKRGIGKRWLAVDACRNFLVVKAMDYKIIWFNASKCNSAKMDLEKLKRLRIILQDEDESDLKTITYSNTSVKNEIIYEQKQIRRILELNRFKNCLIVLSDVRRKETLEAFKLHCKMMITTRHTGIADDISRDQKKMIKINSGFTQNESLELMALCLNRKAGVLNDYELNCRRLHDISSGHPFIMSMIGKTFIVNEDEPFNRKEKRFEDWINALNNYNISEIDMGIPIQETLKQLPEKYEEFYKSLVIFTDNVNIPVTVLKKYWGQSSDSDTEKIVSSLHKNSLLDYCIKGKYPAVSMHYVYYTYLKNKCDMVYINDCHRKLVECYRIDEVLEDRRELDLDFVNDDYFHHCIGFHLKEAEMDQLLSKLYLDFSFLEQKVKYSGLPNTIGDLKTFKDMIVGKSSERRRLLDALIDFLPSTEEVIYKSSDTTLLQYSLTSNNLLIKEYAMNAAEKFPDRLWFFDNDHSADQTQIIRTHQVAKFVKFRTQDSVLIHLINGDISYQDLGVEYSNEPVIYKGCSPNLIDIQTYQTCFFALDDEGCLKVYEFPIFMKFKPTSQYNNLSGHPGHLGPINKYADKKFKITRFRLIDKQDRNDASDIEIVCCLENGQIRLITWTTKKTFSRPKTLPIRMDNVEIIAFNHFGPTDNIMMIDRNGNFKFINLTCTSEVPFTARLNRHLGPVNCHASYCGEKLNPIIVCVFRKVVMEIEFNIKFQGGFLMTESREIYSIQPDNEILCSALTEDASLIVLGTKMGITVIDRLKDVETLRTHVGEEILSLDLHGVDEPDFGSILISVFNNSNSHSSHSDSMDFVSLDGIRRTHRSHDARMVQWASIEIDAISDEDNPRSSISSQSDIFYRFLGDANLFDVWKEENNILSLVLVDDKDRIHFRTSEDRFFASKEKIMFHHKIVEICKHKSWTYVGCREGHIFQLKSKDIATKNSIRQLDGEIKILESIMGKFVVAGTDTSYVILEIPDKIFEGKLIKSFLLNDHLIMSVREDCMVDFIQMPTGTLSQKLIKQPGESGKIVAATHQKNILIMATISSSIIICTIDFGETDEPVITAITPELEYMETMDARKVSITALAISKDTNFYAVGYSTGMIELYSMATKMSLYKLESHKHPICCLKFSPWAGSHAPIILVSVGEQIAFWNINYIQNNPIQLNSDKKLRRSQRFSRRLSSISEPVDEVDSKPVLNGWAENPWINKSGALEKPELLSCIKFVGNRAYKLYHNDDFTNFCTVDNDGIIYYLRLFENKKLIRKDSLAVEFSNFQI